CPGVTVRISAPRTLSASFRPPPSSLAPVARASASSICIEIIRPTLGVLCSGLRCRFRPPRPSLQLLCPLLTSARASRHLAVGGSQSPGTRSDLPGYCKPTFTLMPVGCTLHHSVQVSGFDDFGRLAPMQRLIRFLCVRPALCHQASFRLAVTRETLALG